MAILPWWKYVYALLQTFMIFRTTQGEIECVCSTPHCRQLQLVTCHATAFCYTQHHEASYPVITRGCIDDKTPILCENRRPDGVQGSWPVLHCCQRNFCNKGVVPSVPPWRRGINHTDTQEHLKADIDFSDDYPYDLQPEPEGKPEATSIKSESPEEHTIENPKNFMTMELNPILIAVPLAGACALAAIGVFAVFSLRKRHYTTYERNLQTRHIAKSPPDAVKGSKYSVALSDRCSECSQSKLLAHV